MTGDIPAEGEGGGRLLSAADLPPPGEQHFQIVQKAEEALSAMADGNGLGPRSVRMQRHDTSVHQLEGSVMITLKPDVKKTRKNGNVPVGLVTGSKEQVDGHIAGTATVFFKSRDTQDELLQAAQGDKGYGWGLENHRKPLPRSARDYSVVERCSRCAGTSSYDCTECQGTGKVQCQSCYGSGNVMKPDGSGGTCAACAGRRTVTCRLCGETGQTACAHCAGLGYWTDIYHASYDAVFDFTMERGNLEPGVLAAVDAVGLRAMAEEEAEVFMLGVAPHEKELQVPLAAYFPVAEAEFTAGGKTYPAKVVGLKGRVLEIEPFLDPLVKPGITALLKISNGGGVASAALLETAGKYRVIADALEKLPVLSKKAVYEGIRAEYPHALSDKYARAVVKYAALALLALGRAPRRKGLALGALASCALSALWFMTPVRGLAAGFMKAKGSGQHMPALDVGILTLGYALSVFAIKYLSTQAIEKLRPHAPGKKAPLQPAGEEGLYALASTFIPWLTLAMLAPQRPEWVAALLRMMGI